MASTPPDPAAFFRSMLGEWEKAANKFGGEMMKSEQFAQAMHGATAASLTAQGNLHQVMERALASANMPSRKDLEDLSARLAGVEATLARIEARLAPVAAADRPQPRRTKQPPKPAA